jgi:hypothetical protein
MRHYLFAITFCLNLAAQANVTLNINGQNIPSKSPAIYGADLNAAPALPYENIQITTSFDENLIQGAPPLRGQMTDPSFFRKLRAAIQQAEMEEAKKNQGAGTKHVLRHVRANFVPDSITFAIAGGAVYFAQLQMVTKSDPALMVKHVEALKDPIAHISFAAFMVANGIFIDMKTRGMDPMTKQLVMKSLTYKGLAVGSFFSSLTADVLTTGKECFGSWIANKNDEASHAACDAAFKQWTVRNKFTQYAPTIMSLIAAQAGAEVVENWAKAGGRMVKPGILYTESKMLKVAQTMGANIDIVITPGGPVVKTVRWLGKLTKFTMFLAVDHAVAPTITRIGNNLIQPLFFDFDALAMSKYLVRGSKHSWNEKNAAAADESFAKFPKEIANFTERMAAWRMHLNGKAEADLAGWLDATSQLLHQIDYAKNFYHKYVENLFDTMNRQHLVDRGEFNDDPSTAWARERRYPYRALPLYGVKSNHDYGNVPENDIYLLKPFDIEPRQSAFVKQTATQFLTTLDKYLMTAPQRAEVIAMISALTKDLTPYQQGVQLDFINKYIERIPRPQQVRGEMLPDHNHGLRSSLKDFRKALGNPLPQLYEGSGFAMAFDTHVTNYQMAKAANFDLSDENFKFAKSADLMMFNMVCGPTTGTIDEGKVLGMNLLPPELVSPRIVNYQVLPEFCKDTWIRKTVTSKNIYEMPVTVDGRQYNNLNRFMVSQIYPNLIGDYRDENKSDKGKVFNAWWMNNILPDLQKTLKAFDGRYQKLVDMTYKQVNDEKTRFDFTMDHITNQSYYLDRNIGDNLRFELEVYLATIRSMILGEKITSDVILKDIAERNRGGIQENVFSYGYQRFFGPTKAKFKPFETPYVSERGTVNQFVKLYAPLLVTAGVSATEITSIDDIAIKVINPIRESLGEKIETQEQKTIAAALAPAIKFMQKVRVTELEMNYKNYLALLRSQTMTFDQLSAAKEKLSKSNSAIFGGIKMAAETVGADNISIEGLTLLTIANGLEALEMDVNRYLLMKIKLSDRLELDMTSLNEFMKAQSIAPTQKRGNSPHGQ